MKTTRWQLFTAIGAVIVIAIVGWDLWNSGESSSPLKTEANREAIVLPMLPASAATSRSAALVRTEKAKDWHAFARKTHLQLVTDSLKLNQEVAKLLGLSPTEAQELDEMLGSFLNRLRSEELSHAYVSVSDDGREEIIVPGFPAFDRSNTVNRLRTEVTTKFGSDVGDFIAEEIQWDSNLAAGNFELRLATYRGDDGVDRVEFDRRVRAPENWGSQGALESAGPKVKVKWAATVHMKTTEIVQLGINPRYTHLLSAQETLPRRP